MPNARLSVSHVESIRRKKGCPTDIGNIAARSRVFVFIRHHGLGNSVVTAPVQERKGTTIVVAVMVVAVDVAVVGISVAP